MVAGGVKALGRVEKKTQVNSAVPCGTGFILLSLPRTDVLGYFHAVPPGLPGAAFSWCVLPCQMHVTLSNQGKICYPDRSGGTIAHIFQPSLRDFFDFGPMCTQD